MKKKISKIFATWLIVLCIAVPSALPASAAGETVNILDGAVSMLYPDITTYRSSAGFTYPTQAPTGYENYIFAGWYTDAECKTALSESVAGDKITDQNKAAYAKFVPKNVLSIKAQVLSGTQYESEESSIRFITTVDSLRYQKVGFDFDIKGIKLNSETTTVYHRIKAVGTDGKVLKNYTPDVFDQESKYFMTCIMEGIKNKSFGQGIQVVPYWITLDGTKVTGDASMKSVNMSYVPMTDKISAEAGTTIDFPNADSWNKYKDESIRVSGQGGCFDGTHYYQAIVHTADKTLEANKITIDGSSLEYNQDLNEVIIQKYSLSEEGIWSLSEESEVLEIRHANDITYNSKLSYTNAEGETQNGLLVVSYCGNYNGSKYFIGFLDPEKLILVNPSEIQGITLDESCSINSDENYVKLGQQITNIAYNETRKQYAAGISGTHNIQIMDSNFKLLKTISVFDSAVAKKYVAQGITTDDSYIYFLFSAGSEADYQKNMVAIYDWDGTFINLVQLNDIPHSNEIENISIHKNVIYIAGNIAKEDESNYSQTVIYKVTGFQNFASDKESDKEVFVLNKDATTEIYAETTIKVNSVLADKWPRAGLRLTSGDKNVDFVLAYDNAEKPVNVKVVQKDSEGNEVLQGYAITSELSTDSPMNLKLAVAKQGDTLYFYVNDVLQGTKQDASFGADAAVTASLYSKYAETQFANYSVATEHVEIMMEELQDTFVADGAKTSINFDLLNEEAETPKITTNETAWKGSIVNWNQESAEDFYAETTIQLTGVNTTGKGMAGMVITSGATRYYVMLQGTADEITALRYVSTGDDGWNVKKEETLSTSLTFKDQNVLALSKEGDTLTIYVNEDKAATVNLAEANSPITGKVTVGLAGMMAQATFTDYTYALKTDVSAGTDTYVLDETKSTDVYIESVVRVAETSADKYPRVGLRLTNDAGTNVDFVVAFKQNTTPTYDSTFVVQTNASGDVSDTKQLYSITSVLDTLTTEGIKLAMAKKGDTIYLYINDVLQATKKYEDFGTDTLVTAALYSKSTTSYFSDYEAFTKNIATPMVELNEVFEADQKKKQIYFDLLQTADETPTVNTNETGNWDAGSIVNWRDVSERHFYVETKVDIIKSNASSSAYAGLVLTQGENRFFVLLYGDVNGITRVCAYSMTKDVFNDKVSVYSNTVDAAEEYKLAVYRNNAELYILVNDEVQKVIDLANVAYPITGACQIGLTGWKADAKFTDYSVKMNKEVPSLETYKPFVIQNNMADFEWNTEFDRTNNEIILGVNSTSSTSNQKMTLSESDMKNVYVEASVNTSVAGTGVWPRAGLRLTNEAGENVDFVMNYKKEATPSLSSIYVIRSNASDKDHETSVYTRYSLTDTTEELKTVVANGKDIKMAIAKQGDKLYFYINDELQVVTSYDGFGAENPVSARFFSKATITKYTDYKVVEGYESNVSVMADVMNLNVEAIADVYAETIVKTAKASTGAYPRVGLRLTNGAGENVDYVIAFKKNVTPTYDSFFAIRTNAKSTDISGTKKSFTLTSELQKALTTTGVKLALAKIDGTLYFYANDVLVGTTTYEGFGADDVVTASLYSKVTESTFTKFGLPGIGQTVALAGDTFAEAKTTKNLVIADGVPNMEVQITGTSTAHGYLYFKEKSTKVYAESLVSLPKTTADSRAGLVLTNADKDTQLGVYLVAGTNSATVTNLQIYALNGFANAWGNQERNIKITDITGLENIGRENIKLSVLRDGTNYTVCVNDIPVVTNATLPSREGFNITSTTETYIGLIGMQQSATFSKFNYMYGDAVNTN